MTRQLLSVDEFRSSAKDGSRPAGTVLRLATSDAVDVDGQARTKRFVFSDGSVDRSGDTIDPKGWELDNFLKNSVALWAHDSSAPPIGRAMNVGVSGAKLIGDIEFAPAETYAFADTIFRLVDGGYIKAVSVGFMPLDWEFAKEKDRPYGIDFKSQELLEISICPVPCNASALLEAKAAGIEISPLREWAEKLLDSNGSVIVPRDVLEETFRQAKTPRAVRQKYLSPNKSESSDWKVGAARDLPIDDADGWDGPAAAKRMLDAAGFDGDSPDSAKAARGFLIHDAANPTLRASYKLPFADVVGGELKAVKAGIQAAASRVMQTDAPVAILDDAKAVVDAYDKKAGEGKEMSEDDVPTGNCGRAKDDECGMKNPAECAIHAPQPDKSIPSPEEKSGRRISRANEALLRKVMDHHESATKCIKDVLASNETDEPDDDENGNEIEVPLTDEDKRAKRLAEARALKAAVKL